MTNACENIIKAVKALEKIHIVPHYNHKIFYTCGFQTIRICIDDTFTRYSEDRLKKIGTSVLKDKGYDLDRCKFLRCETEDA